LDISNSSSITKIEEKSISDNKCNARRLLNNNDFGHHVNTHYHYGNILQSLTDMMYLLLSIITISMLNILVTNMKLFMIAWHNAVKF
jgi:hypothetical protein